MNDSKISLNVSDLTPKETVERLRQLADLIEACMDFKNTDGVIDYPIGFGIDRQEYKSILEKSNSSIQRNWFNDDGDEDFFIENIVIAEYTRDDIVCVDVNSRVAEWIVSGETFEKFYSDRLEEDKT